MKYYLGIDGGGTKTVAAVSDEKGNILTKKTGKSINFYSVGMNNARKHLSDMIAEICNELGVSEFSGVFIGCSALDDKADDTLVNELCSGVVPSDSIVMHSDVYIALKSVSDAKCPCAAICGTGSMAIAEDSDSVSYVTGGWGHIIGDEGSAYSIALNALKLCCRNRDAENKTALVECACKHFGVADFRQIIDIIYSPDTTKDVIALFAEKVGILANDGVSAAAEIIRTEAELFADTVITLVNKADCDVVCLFGSVFKHNELFTAAFSEKVKKYCSKTHIRMSEIPAEESAVKLAREL